MSLKMCPIQLASNTLEHSLDTLRNELSLSMPPLVCVASKYATCTDIRALYKAGYRVFGENKVQAGIEKINALQDLKTIDWHFIGKLQKNKVRKAIRYFSTIQSIDTISLLERIDTIAGEENRTVSGFIQINPGDDPDKSGFSLAEFSKYKETFFTFKNVIINGLLVVTPLDLSHDKRRALFNASHTVFKETFTSPHAQLSMGMSGDYPLAVAAGATMVRIGRLLFMPSKKQ